MMVFKVLAVVLSVAGGLFALVFAAGAAGAGGSFGGGLVMSTLAAAVAAVVGWVYLRFFRKGRAK